MDSGLNLWPLSALGMPQVPPEGLLRLARKTTTAAELSCLGKLLQEDAQTSLERDETAHIFSTMLVLCPTGGSPEALYGCDAHNNHDGSHGNSANDAPIQHS